MMRKILLFLLTMLLCFGVLVACNTPEDSSSGSEPTNSSDTNSEDLGASDSESDNTDSGNNSQGGNQSGGNLGADEEYFGDAGTEEISNDNNWTGIY